MKRISILGSTGSIGTQTLDIVRLNDDVKVEALTAHKNIDLLEKQIREFRPRVAAIWEDKRYRYQSVLRYGRTYRSGDLKRS